MSSIKRAFDGFGTDILNGIRERMNEHLDEAAFQERLECIHKATLALKEVGTDREEIIRLLQKYWDLRRSEAESFIDEE